MARAVSLVGITYLVLDRLDPLLEAGSDKPNGNREDANAEDAQGPRNNLSTVSVIKTAQKVTTSV